MYDDRGPSAEATETPCFCVTNALVSKGSAIDATQLCDWVAEPADDSEPSADVAAAIGLRFAVTDDDRAPKTGEADEVIDCVTVATVNRPPNAELAIAVPLPISVAVMLVESAPNAAEAVDDCVRFAVTDVDSGRALEAVAELPCVAVAEVTSAPNVDEATAVELPLFVAATLVDNAPNVPDPDAVWACVAPADDDRLSELAAAEVRDCVPVTDEDRPPSADDATAAAVIVAAADDASAPSVAAPVAVKLRDAEATDARPPNWLATADKTDCVALTEVESAPSVAAMEAVFEDDDGV